MDFSLSPQQQQIQQLARQFASQQIAPRAAELDRTQAFPREIFQQALELGLLNVTIPEAYGGPGLGLLDWMLIVEQLAIVDHRLPEVLRGVAIPIPVRVAVVVPLGDRVRGAVVRHHARVIHRDIGRALLEVSHWIAARLHHLTDQPVALLHGLHRLIDESCLHIPPRVLVALLRV